MSSQFSLAATSLLCAGHATASPADLRTTAHEYYQWRDAAYPVVTSDQGKHRYDNRVADYRMAEVVRRREHVSDLLSKVNATSADGWSKDDRIDRILFQSQLAGADFFGRQLDPESSDPQLYVNECTNAIFSLLKKDYPGIYDKDPVGFYFIPTYNPNSGNFYIRAAIEDPRPILAHEGIPGHFLQLSIANHLPDEIRLQHADTVFTEGWALYGRRCSRARVYTQTTPWHRLRSCA